MGLFDVFKSKSKRLEVPTAPPSISRLPDLPSDIPRTELPPMKMRVPVIERMEKKAMREEMEELDEREHLALKKPIFVDMDMFRVMMDELTTSRRNLKEMEDALVRVEDFRSDKDKEFEKWRKAVEDMQRKLIFADRTLFGRS